MRYRNIVNVAMLVFGAALAAPVQAGDVSPVFLRSHVTDPGFEHFHEPDAAREASIFDNLRLPVADAEGFSTIPGFPVLPSTMDGCSAGTILDPNTWTYVRAMVGSLNRVSRPEVFMNLFARARQDLEASYNVMPYVRCSVPAQLDGDSLFPFRKRVIGSESGLRQLHPRFAVGVRFVPKDGALIKKIAENTGYYPTLVCLGSPLCSRVPGQRDAETGPDYAKGRSVVDGRIVTVDAALAFDLASGNIARIETIYGFRVRDLDAPASAELQLVVKTLRDELSMQQPSGLEILRAGLKAGQALKSLGVPSTAHKALVETFTNYQGRLAIGGMSDLETSFIAEQLIIPDAPTGAADQVRFLRVGVEL